jgi:molecular chaperone HtpG
LEFVEKYEGENKNNGIIGHFGLGFYSSFMVSDTVEVITKSYTGTPAVHWTCNGEGVYETAEGTRNGHGTTVIMHVSEEESAYLEKYKIEEMLEKYCAFMPVEIYFTVENDEDEKDEKKDEKEPEAPKPVNDTTPLWLKNPSDCTPEDYKEFYRKVFHDYREPLFWIHVNADYPLNFRGILYFPRITNEYESIEGQVKLYYNQVFVADNIKEVIPDFLLMLRGVIDCPELPLNVSRSYLQNSSYVDKMSKHIVKKVADKLNSLFNTEREKYESLWPDVKIFVEYGSLREKKFYDRVKDSVLYPLTNGSTVTLGEYLEGAKEKHENTVYYATDKTAQSRYISMLEAQDIGVAYLDRGLDNQFITMVEQDSSVKFLRVDSALADALKGEGEKYESEALTKLFNEVGGEGMKVTFEVLKDTEVPAILTVSEESRRFGEMMKLYGMGDGMPAPETSLVLNTSCDTVLALEKKAESDPEGARDIAKQLLMLATLAQRQLTAEEMKEFLAISYKSIGDRL